MTDPYKVLGISPQASDEEVKTAYRKLSQQYHPDHHADSVMEEIANQKMAEINAAYDQIMNMRQKRNYLSKHQFILYRYQKHDRNDNYTARTIFWNKTETDANAEWNFLKVRYAFQEVG